MSCISTDHDSDDVTWVRNDAFTVSKGKVVPSLDIRSSRRTSSIASIRETLMAGDEDNNWSNPNTLFIVDGVYANQCFSKNLFKYELSFEKLLLFVQSQDLGDEEVCFHDNLVYLSSPSSSQNTSELEEFGFEIVPIPQTTCKSCKRTCKCSEMISLVISQVLMDKALLSNRIMNIVLFAGEGDFSTLSDILRRMSRRLFVIGSDSCMDSSLKNRAKSIFFVEQYGWLWRGNGKLNMDPISRALKSLSPNRVVETISSDSIDFSVTATARKYLAEAVSVKSSGYKGCLEYNIGDVVAILKMESEHVWIVLHTETAIRGKVYAIDFVKMDSSDCIIEPIPSYGDEPSIKSSLNFVQRLGSLRKSRPSPCSRCTGCISFEPGYFKKSKCANCYHHKKEHQG